MKIFIHSRIQGDYNIITYSLKKEKSRRNKTSVTHVYFIPNENGNNNDLLIANEIKRGKQFFSKKDGFLFGALMELRKLGNLVTEEA